MEHINPAMNETIKSVIADEAEVKKLATLLSEKFSNKTTNE